MNKLTEHQASIIARGMIEAAKLAMVDPHNRESNFPYFASGVFGIGFYPDTTGTMPTMAIDKHYRVVFNSEFVMGLSVHELVGVLVHEFMHAHLRHHERNTQWDMTTRNIAADLAINSMPKLQRILPDICVYPSKYNFEDGLICEQYAELLPKIGGGNGPAGKPGDNKDENDNDSSGNDSDKSDDSELVDDSVHESTESGDRDNVPDDGSDNSTADNDSEIDSSDDGNEGPQDSAGNNSSDDSDAGSDRDSVDDHHSDFTGSDKQPWELPDPSDGGPEGLNPVDISRLEKEVSKAIQSDEYKACGDLGANMVRDLVARLSAPKVRWQSILRSEIRKASNYIRGNTQKQYRSSSILQACAPQGVIFPSNVSPVPEVAVVIDTSGSMGDEELQSCIDECVGILKSLGGIPATFYSCDSQVATPHKTTDAKSIKLQGGGGTDMRVGIDGALKQGKPVPNIVIVLTDGYTPWPDKEIRGVKIIACVVGRYHTTDGVPSFIKTVVVED